MARLVLKKTFQAEEVVHSSLLFICNYPLISEKISRNLIGGLQTCSCKAALKALRQIRDILQGVSSLGVRFTRKISA